MKMKRALQIVLLVAFVGITFSGFLTWRDFVGQAGACSPLAQPGTLFGYPPCVYGLIMYAVVAAVAAWGLVGKR